MRAPRTIVAYLLREVSLYTLLGLAVIVVVLVTRNLVRALEDLADAGLTGGDLLLVLRLLGTMLVIYALPISFLFGVLLAIGRMAADVEIKAMRACGIGLRSLVVPVLVLGVLLSGLMLRFTLEAEPAARREMYAAIKTLLARGGAVEPGKFRRFGSNRMLYVESRDGDGILRGIVVSDRSVPDRPFLVFASSGKVDFDDVRSEMVITLSSGDIHVQAAPPIPDGTRAVPVSNGKGDDDERYQRIAFDDFEYRVGVASLLGAGRRAKPKEMTMAQLAEAMELAARGETRELRAEPVEYALNWHRRMAMPMAPALFGLVGVPIAMRRTRGARAMGMLWCAALAFGYYVLQTFCDFLSLEGWVTPAAASWAPNLAFALLGLALLWHARRQGM